MHASRLNPDPHRPHWPGLSLALAVVGFGLCFSPFCPPLSAQQGGVLERVPVAPPSVPDGVGSQTGVVPLPEPDPYIDRENGIRAVATGDFRAAAGFFRKYRTATEMREPELADATVLLGKALLRAGEAQEALKALEYHAAHSKAELEPYYRDALGYVKGAALLGTNRSEAAVQVLLPISQGEREPELTRLVLESLGEAYFLLRDWDNAEAVFRRLLKEFPASPDAGRTRVALMKSLLAAGKGDEAGACLAEFERDPRGLEKILADRFRVHVLLLRGDVPAAFSTYERIAGERPRQPDAEWWTLSSQLAGGLLRAGQLEDALVVLSHATALAVTEENRAESMLRTAEAYVLLKNTNLAIDTLEGYRKAFPKRPEIVPVMVKLAELLRSTENYMSSADYFGKVVSNPGAPGNMRYRSAISRGWCFREAGQFAKAVQGFLDGEALGSTPTEKGNAVFLAAESAYGISDYATSAKYYKEVADRYPNTPFADKARFREGRSQFNRKEYSAAAEAYGAFLRAFPESPSAETAELERGIALRFAAKSPEEFAEALRELQQFAGRRPASPSAPRACLEGFEAALGAGKPRDAVSMLTALVEGYPDSELYPHGLYERARLRFSLGDDEKAVTDSVSFLAKFPLLPLAPDVFVWLGDYYANAAKYEDAKGTYLKLVTTHPSSALAPLALYEAAQCDYRLGNLTSALALAEKLETLSDPEPGADILAKIHMLHGDILARQGSFEEAIPHFSRARQAAADTPLGLAALGRRGDMYMSLAGGKQENIQEALDCFSSLAANPNCPPDLLEVARYRMAKCQELLGNADSAIEGFLSVYYQYEHDLGQGIVRDWFYYYRSAYEAARLYELSGERGKLRLAARLYDRLADSGIPGARDARRRAREIRRTHDMVD